MSPALPPPTLPPPPPQAARTTAAASAPPAATDARNLVLLPTVPSSFGLFKLFRGCSSCFGDPLGRNRALGIGLPDHVYVLRSPGKLHLCPSSWKSLALRLVGVWHQNRHQYLVRQLHDQLGRGP